VAGLALLGLGTAAPLSAQEPAAVVVDEVITVTATRVPAPGFDVPASIDVLSAADLHDDRLGIDLSESLPGVPGVLARNRQNYAQDTQVSIRGFGSRATFGIRGLRLYLDGIPATQPDGQAQMAHFNLASAERLEILRGPFSSLYGNASGGVMQLFTKSGRDAPRFSGGTAAGSFGTWRANLGGGGSVGAADYVFDFTRFDTEGYREHSAARRESFNGKLDYRFSERSRSTVVLNYFDSPETDDPLGLTRAQFEIGRAHV
jgi:iron complex outermembrane receptor protein